MAMLVSECVVVPSSQNTACDTAPRLSARLGARPQLGSEHCFTRRGDTRKEKHIDHFNRDPKTILLVDCDALSETITPGNTILVK